MSAALDAILFAGNCRLHYWADRLLGPRRRPAFRNMLLRGEIEPEKLCFVIGDAEKLTADLPMMQAVVDQELNICQGYSRMVNRLAGRLAEYARTTILDKDDLVSEGFFGLREALFGYAREDVKFMTYAYIIVRRKMQQAIRRANPFSKLGRVAQLLDRYHQEEAKATGDPRNHNEIMMALRLSAKDEVELTTALVKQIPASQIAEDGEWGNDYSILGDVHRPVQGELFEKMLDKASLNDFEKACIIASQSGRRGWQVEVAKEHINPKTGQPYSRMSVKLVLRRAYSKLIAA